jgi:hypothetical protein
MYGHLEGEGYIGSNAVSRDHWILLPQEDGVSVILTIQIEYNSSLFAGK